MMPPSPPKDVARHLAAHARAEGLALEDVELLTCAMRKAEHWPDEFADRLGHGPGAQVVVRSHVCNAVDEVELVAAFKADPSAYRSILRWLLNRPLTPEKK